MKGEYPEYRRNGTEPIYSGMSKADRDVLDGFLAYCRVTAADSKVMGRRSEMLQVYDIIEKPFDELVLEDLRRYLAVLKRSNRKAWTRKCILTTLQMFIKWRFRDWSQRFDNLDDLRRLSRLTRPNNADRYNEHTLPTAEDVDRMIRKARSIRDKLYVAMAWEAGLPPKVELNLRWSNVAIDRPMPGVSTLEYFRTKNSESFVFPLGKTTTYYLKQWRQEYEYPNRCDDDLLFPSPSDRNRPLSTTTAWHMLRRLASRARLDKPMYQYLLRHKTLSDNYDRFPEEIHRRLFGHVRGSAQTRTYSHVREKSIVLQVALEKLHQVGTIGDASAGPSHADKRLMRDLEELRATMAQASAREIAARQQISSVQDGLGQLRQEVERLIAGMQGKAVQAI